MTGNNDLRTILRDADPAASHELSPADRARMKAAVLAAASEPRTRWSRPLVLKLAVGTAVALLAILVGRRMVEPAPRTHVTAAPSPAPKVEIATQPPTAVPEPLPAVIQRPARPRHAPRPESAQEATRILFTAPEGTRILWFVGSPPASEERS
jgi:hypothetical protein